MAAERALVLVLLCSACTLDSSSRSTSSLFDGPSILTQHNDAQRTGANLAETVLDTTVNVANFGKLFTRQVDGFIYAQPLVVSGLTIHGKKRTVVFVATEHNSLYAFDGEDPAAGQPLWQVSLGTPVDAGEYPCKDLIPEDGITSTPVIDPATGILYVSAKHKDNGVYAQTLHALDMLTGEEKLGGPVDFGGSVAGGGWGSSDGNTVSFDAKLQLQRPALLLSHGQLYVGFGSHCDKGAYHGWLMAYDAKTLAQTAIWNTTPDGGQGSIWMSGQGPAADADGQVYVVTADGDATSDGAMLSDALVKLSPRLVVEDWFLPYNFEFLQQMDLDLGVDGALLVPNSKLLITGSKQGFLYVVDRSAMGHYHQGDDRQIVQSFRISENNVHGTPVFWQGPSEAYIYVWPEVSALMAFRFESGALDAMPSSQSGYSAPKGMPGGFLSISAHGSTQGSAILWASLPLSMNANSMTVDGVLRAFDAADVGHELWNSEQNPDRDHVGSFAKFNPPTILGGKVYLGTFSGELLVYGLVK